MFDMRCEENGIEHRLTKVRHPWTKGQVERMSRTIKEATVKRYHYDTHDQLDTLLRCLQLWSTSQHPEGANPHEFICKTSTKELERFRLDPTIKVRD